MRYLVQGQTGPFEVTIGLEVHAQIVSQSKLFSGASATYGAEPNTQVSLIDAGFPGMLPTLNRECVFQAIRTGLGLEGQVQATSFFDRKNYFYADLPTGYQITQFAQPIMQNGRLSIEKPDGSVKTIRINRLHIEQDAGKSFHDLYPEASAIDLNRAGVGLMEIVSEPDLHSPEEAALYLKKLRALLRYLETCDGNMEEGSLRADANVSVARSGEPLGTRVEIKNLNSVRFLQQAVVYEAQRQVNALEAGEVIVQETRLFDVARGMTRVMRTKEDAQDYRYFPDPDLPPLVVEESVIEELRQQLPELPDAKRGRFEREYALSPYDASVLVSEKEVTWFFERASACLQKASPKLVANWMMGDLFAYLNRENLEITASPVSAEHMAALVDLIADETISGKIAKDVFQEMVQSGEAPGSIVDAKGLRQITDTGAIRQAIEAILQREAEKVAEYRSGKEKLFGYFVGVVMKEMKGKGNPALINLLLKELLDSHG